MITFSYVDAALDEHQAKMFINPAVSGNKAVLQLDKHRFEQVLNGDAALELLAVEWKCSKKHISHDLPVEILTPARELDFTMFYNGHSFMARDEAGTRFRRMWAKWTVQDENHPEPAWEDAVVEFFFPDQPQYSDAVIERAIATETDLASRCIKLVRENRMIVKVVFKRNQRICFPLCVGSWEDTKFHVRYLSPKMTWIRVTPLQDTEQLKQIIAEEKTRAVVSILSDIFPDDSDVATILNYSTSLLREVSPLPEIGSTKHDVFWINPDRQIALVVRIPVSGKIRCPNIRQRGQLIGRKAEIIKELTLKHRFMVRLRVY